MKKILFTLFVLFAGVASFAQNAKITVDNVQLEAGGQTTITINVTNATKYDAAGMYIELPKGFTFVYDEDEELYVSSGDVFAKSHTLSGNFLNNENNVYRIAVVSLKNAAFAKDNGSLVKATITCGANMAEGEYNARIKNIEFSKVGSGLYTINDVPFKITVGRMQAEPLMSNNMLKLAAVTGMPGDELVVPIEMENEDEICAVASFFKVPSGFSVENMEAVKTRCPKHNVSYTYQGNGVYKFALLDMSTPNSAIKSNNGAIINVTLKVDESVAVGDYNFTMSTIEYTSGNGIMLTSNDYTTTITIKEMAKCSMSAIALGGRVGGEIAFPVSLTNEEESISDVDFWVTLPEGVILRNYMLTARTMDQTLDYKLRNGSHQFKITSSQASAFKGKNGIIVDLSLKAENSMNPGDYEVKVSNIVLYTTSGKEIPVSDFTTALTLTDKRPLTLLDITELINDYLMQQEQ